MREERGWEAFSSSEKKRNFFTVKEAREKCDYFIGGNIGNLGQQM